MSARNTPSSGFSARFWSNSALEIRPGGYQLENTTSPLGMDELAGQTRPALVSSESHLSRPTRLLTHS